MAAIDINPDQPHSARIYDFLLGGKDNFPSDRAAAARLVAAVPSLPVSMRANRRFMVRVARYLAGERGIRQFLDIGTGLPTSPNLHEIVQRKAPDARVVYVDNDPIVLSHARALLTSSVEGRTSYLRADLRAPDAILAAPEAGILDLSRPVALSLIAILQFFEDEQEVRQILDRLVKPLAPGSALALSAVTADHQAAIAKRGLAASKAAGIPNKARTKAETEALFAGFELVDPGVVLVHQWRADEQAEETDDAHVFMYGGVGVKP